ncbi:MAG TPA: S9 family peptidase [Blastocatellia bacterium]|nr:S9 family peptidase [Blastocatellia bacterium]
MRRRSIIIAALLALISLGSVAEAQNKQLTIDDIFDPVKRVDFSGSPPTNLRWLKDGTHYLQSKPDPRPPSFTIMKVNAATGEAVPFFDTAKMEAAFAAIPGLSRDDAKRIAHRASYRMNEAETAALINTANDLFYYEFGSDRAVRLTNSTEPEEGEEFSPDSRMVAFVRGNNLYVVDVATQRERALTNDGGPKTINGQLDWVYQEELYGRGNFKAYWWSPDSTRLAYLRFDESPVHQFTIVDHIPHFQDVEQEFYPKAGDPNPIVRLGVVAAAGGPTRWVDIFNYEGVDPLLVRVGWTPDGKKVVYEIQDREQTWLDLNYADPASGKSETLFREKTKAWVDVGGVEFPIYLKDGSFLISSERTGFQHLYHYSPEGRLIRQVTDGKWEIGTLYGVDEASGYIYFSSSTERSAIESHIYRIKLDGTGLTRLTETAGWHTANFNPTFTQFIDNWSDVNTPTQVRLYDASGKLARVIDENKVEALKQYKLGKVEFLQVKTRDGFVMEAMMIKPPDFDPSKKYPVMEYTYSGPHAPQVRNAWGGATFLWHQMLAEKGYIIWVCDNRSASGKGIEPTWQIYGNFGPLELRDLEDGIEWLKSQPYVDGSRIGLWGWSFGGFMTSYALTHSKSFKLGIAGGSVTDWRLYDTIYTERYMKTPQNNAEGYKKTAPQAAAKDLSGKLLLIHGMIDDNVHMQNTIQFAYELQRAGKPFQLMLYPKSRHGVVDPLLVKHMRSMMTDFILANL